MLKKVLILLCFTSTTIIMSCKSNIPLSVSEDTKPDDIEVYLLSDSESIERRIGSEYIEGREVIKKVVLSSHEKQGIITALFDENNYEPINRKCEFSPVFAIEHQNVLMATLDVEYCPFVKLIDKYGVQNNLQLITDNTLKNILSGKD